MKIETYKGVAIFKDNFIYTAYDVPTANGNIKIQSETLEDIKQQIDEIIIEVEKE